MPNSKQAKKHIITDDRRRISNKMKMSAMKTAVKKVLEAEDAESASAALPEAVKRIDKCTKHNIIHENTGARKKSRLAKHVAAR